LLGVREQLARRLALLRVIEDGGEPARQLPRREEERPVDVPRELLERGFDRVRAEKAWRRQIFLAPADLEPVRVRHGQRQEGFVALLRVQLAQLGLLLSVLAVELGAA